MVSKGAPDFCTVYIIANKGKVTVKQSTAPAPAKPVASPRTQIQPPPPRPQLLHQLTNASEVSSSETNKSCSQSGKCMSPISILISLFKLKHSLEFLQFCVVILLGVEL